MNWISIVIILAGLFFSALFSGVETGSYMINRIRLRRRERARRPAAMMLARMLRQPQIFVFTVLIGHNIAVYLLSKTVTDCYLSGGLQGSTLFLGFIPWNAEIAATLTLTFPLFILAEVGPKNLFRKRADSLMYRCSGLMQFFVWFFWPFTWSLRFIYRLLTRGLATESVYDLHRLSPDALKEYFSTSTREGIISEEQERMLDNATSMHRVPLRSIMTSLREIPCLSMNATVADFKRLCAQYRITYVLLMDQHRVEGIVSLFSVVERNMTDDQLLEKCAEDVLNIQDSWNLKSAFYRLRRNPRHCAVVVDSRRHPVGFVRLEDIARFIAGS